MKISKREADLVTRLVENMFPEGFTAKDQIVLLNLADKIRKANDFQYEDYGTAFVALPDGFLCEDCARDAGLDLGDDAVEVWEVGGGGWLGPCVCKNCKLSIPVVIDGVEAEGVTDQLTSTIDALRRVLQAEGLRERHGEDTIGVLMKCGVFRSSTDEKFLTNLAVQIDGVSDVSSTNVKNESNPGKERNQ